MRQAIVTKYLGATDTQGARVSASCESGRSIVAWKYNLSSFENHEHACKVLQQKMSSATKVWLDDMICGALPDGRKAFVFVEEIELNEQN